MSLANLPEGAARAVLEALDDAVVLLDVTSRVLYANPATGRLLGCDPGELLGRVGFSLVHPDDVLEAQRHFAAFFTDEEVEGSVRYRLKRTNGEWIAVEATGGVIDGSEGRLAAISMRPEANREHVDIRDRYSSEFLRALLDNVQVGIVACDAEGRVLVFNEKLRSQYRQPDGRQRIDEWIQGAEYFEADGITPLAPERSPVYRTIRGETVRNAEYASRTSDGTIRYRRANGQVLYDSEGRKIGAVVSIEDLTDQRAAEEALRRQALYDPLTGLPNRALLASSLLASIRAMDAGREGPAVFFLDLDNFKVVNDSLGHTAGDRLLVEIGARLDALFGPQAIVARLGGDEFVIAIDCLEVERGVAATAQQILDAVTGPVSIDGKEVRVTASLGVALAEGPGDSAERLLRDADTAMYLAKDSGRNRWKLFDRSLRDAVVRRMAAEQALRKAMTDGRLRAAFQPIVSAATRHVLGFEALARYEGEDGRLVEPETFIEVAEQAGLISRIDLFVFDAACRFAESIEPLRTGGALPFISCNFSGGTLTREDLVPLVLGNLNRHRIGAERLRLELTETTLITSTQHTRNALAVLRAAGVGIGIDDFGTGYSSLTYLRDLPVSFVKIDQSFIQGLLASLEDAAIVRAVVRLARALGKSVTAEGVEDDEQAIVLEGFGCDALQGFLFGAPMSAADARELFRRGELAAA